MPAPWMPPLEITPDEYERQVQTHLRQSGAGLLEFRVTRRESIRGSDGRYEIDCVARFEALGAAFVVLIECKLTKRPIEREVVQVLHDRIRSTGAHKGMIFSTAGFQSGALEYAAKHGIATVQFSDGRTAWGTRSRPDGPSGKPPWAPAYAAWFVKLIPGGGESHSIMRDRRDAFVEAFSATVGDV